MLGFAWRPTDEGVAALLSFVRDSWGNGAGPVSAVEVAKMRRRTAALPIGPSRADSAVGPGGGGGCGERRMSVPIASMCDLVQVRE